MTPDRLHAWVEELLEALRFEIRALETILNSEQRNKQGHVDCWSPKDEIGHLAYWLGVFAHNLRAIRTGGRRIDTGPFLEMNRAAWARYRDLSWNEAVSKLDSAVDGIQRETRRLPSHPLVLPGMTRPWIRDLVYETVEHPMHHVANLYRKLDLLLWSPAMLARWGDVVKRRGMARWTVAARRKLERHSQSAVLKKPDDGFTTTH